MSVGDDEYRRILSRNAALAEQSIAARRTAQRSFQLRQELRSSTADQRDEIERRLEQEEQAAAQATPQATTPGAQAPATPAAAAALQAPSTLEAFRRERHLHESLIAKAPADAAAARPEIAQQFQRWQALARANDPQAPAALQSALQMSIDWQQSQRVPPSRVVPLSSSMVTAIVDGAASAPTDRARVEILRSVTQSPDGDARGRVVAQLRGQGPEGENRIPDALDLVLDIAEDPMRRQRAANVYGALRRPPPRPDDGAGKDLAQQATDAFGAPSAIGAILARQYAVTHDRDYMDRHAELRDVGTRVARVYGDARRAMEDLFGHIVTLSRDGLAHVYVPAGTDLDALQRGMVAMRRSAADRLIGERRPRESGIAQHTLDAAELNFPTTATWVNQGGSFALIEPASGAAVVRASMEELLAAAEPQPLRSRSERNRERPDLERELRDMRATGNSTEGL